MAGHCIRPSFEQHTNHASKKLLIFLGDPRDPGDPGDFLSMQFLISS